MEQYVGLDVSQKETAICVIDGEGKRVWQGTCRSIPDMMAEVVRTRAPLAVKVAMETGPLAVWHWHELKKAGVTDCLYPRPPCEGGALDANQQDRCQRRLRAGSDRAHGMVPSCGCKKHG